MKEFNFSTKLTNSILKTDNYLGTELVRTEEGLKLIAYTIEISVATNKYTGNEFDCHKKTILENHYAILPNDETKPVELSPEFLTILPQLEGTAAVTEWVLELLLRNPNVYEHFTQTEVNYSQGLLGYTCLATKLIKFANSLDGLEKMIKTMGERLFNTAFTNSNFCIEEKNNLRDITGLSSKTLQLLSQLNERAVVLHMQDLAKINPNYPEVMLEYLLAVKKVFKRKSRHNESISYFIKKALIILNLESSLTLKQVLNYCLKESFFFSQNPRFQLVPENAICELCDYLKAMNDLNVERYERFPKDIFRTMSFLSRNMKIFKDPRPEAFSMAVAAYKHLEFQSAKYIFRTPIDEKDLFDEGTQLQHCVANYRDDIIDNGTVVIFMRKIEAPNESFVTIEYYQGLLAQAKTNYDQNVDDSTVLDEIINWLKKKGR